MCFSLWSRWWSVNSEIFIIAVVHNSHVYLSQPPMLIYVTQGRFCCSSLYSTLHTHSHICSFLFRVIMLIHIQLPTFYVQLWNNLSVFILPYSIDIVLTLSHCSDLWIPVQTPVARHGSKQNMVQLWRYGHKQQHQNGDYGGQSRLNPHAISV